MFFQCGKMNFTLLSAFISSPTASRVRFDKKQTAEAVCRSRSFILSSVFRSQLFQFGITGDDLAVVFPKVRKEAACADFDALFGIPEVAAALVSEGVKRTITEQAVEILGL